MSLDIDVEEAKLSSEDKLSIHNVVDEFIHSVWDVEECAKEFLPASVKNSIKKMDDIVNETGYIVWPLFRDFRDSPEFLKSFEQIFGYKYSVKLSCLAEEKRAEVSGEIS